MRLGGGCTMSLTLRINSVESGRTRSIYHVCVCVCMCVCVPCVPYAVWECVSLRLDDGRPLFCLPGAACAQSGALPGGPALRARAPPHRPSWCPFLKKGRRRQRERERKEGEQRQCDETLRLSLDKSNYTHSHTLTLTLIHTLTQLYMQERSIFPSLLCTVVAIPSQSDCLVSLSSLSLSTLFSVSHLLPSMH